MNEMNPWDSIQVPSRDVSARRVDHTHPLSFFWAKDYRGRYLFFCEFEEDTPLPSRFPSIAGIEILPPDDTRRLILILKSKSDWRMFFALCNDIVRTTFDIHKTSSSVAVIIRRLNRWREFLKKSSTLLLSEEKIKGLMGELLFIKKYMEPVFGIQQSILFWRGPEGYSQDFEINDCAVEIKCQSGVSSPHVKISSEDQLCSQLPHLYLHVVTLGRAVQEDGLTHNLPELVEEIRQQLLNQSPDMLEVFNDKIFEIGFVDLEEYNEYNYINTKMVTYAVVEDFPRICRKDLHEAIQKVKYSISLSHCETYLGVPDWMET